MSQDFTVGINLAWLDKEYDHDFGTNQTREHDLGKKLPVAYETKKADFEEYIKDISELGIHVVRLWLFERFEGLTFGAQGTVSDHTSDIMYNLIDACKIAKKYNVRFYFCLCVPFLILNSSSFLPTVCIRSCTCWKFEWF